MKREDLEDNPFLVLAVSITATRLEIERAGQKLLAQLAIEASSAATYETPFGPKRRDEAKVRTALATLRDPEERVKHEIWLEALASSEGGESIAWSEWSEALESVGWRGPCTE